MTYCVRFRQCSVAPIRKEHQIDHLTKFLFFCPIQATQPLSDFPLQVHQRLSRVINCSKSPQVSNYPYAKEKRGKGGGEREVGVRGETVGGEGGAAFVRILFRPPLTRRCQPRHERVKAPLSQNNRTDKHNKFNFNKLKEAPHCKSNKISVPA